MAFFNEFPNTRTYDSDLGWLIATVKQLIDRIDGYNEVHFADPIAWSISTQYDTATIVRDPGSGDLYISKQPVPNGILLTNTAYWEPLGTGGAVTAMCEIINVQDYGALGVPGADYTIEINNAINDGEIIYFPAGTYSFGTISVNKDLYIFGEGADSVLVPLHRSANNNEYKPMFECSGVKVTFDSLNFTGDNSIVSETGTQEYTQAIIRAYNGNVTFKGCSFNDLRSVYRLSEASRPFTEREGILLFAYGCDLTIDGCEFGDCYGNELIWSSRSRVDFEKGTTVIKNNTFNNRNGAPVYVTTDGSYFDILGGTIYFENNSGHNSYFRGTFANLFGDVVNVNNNMFTEFYGPGGVIDTCEGYYIKNSTAVIQNNYFDMPTADTSLKIFAKSIRVVNNHLTGTNPMKVTVSVDYGVTDTYHAADNLETSLEDITVINNTILSTQDGATYSNTGLVIGQAQQSAGSRGVYDKYVIQGNEFRNGSGVTSPRQQLEIITNANIVVVKDNIFNEPGAAQSGSRLAFIGTNDSAAMKMIIDGNYFAPASAATNVIFGSSGSLANLTAIFSANSTEDTTNIHSGPSTLTATILSNNANILV